MAAADALPHPSPDCNGICEQSAVSGYEFAEGVGGLHAEFVAQELAAQLVLPVGLPLIALSQVGPDQHPMGAFAERLGGNSCKPASMASP